MPPAIPNYDLGILITVDICLALFGLVGTFIASWAIIRQANTNTTYLAEIAQRTAASTEHVAQIAERIDARLRRQFPDIGGELGD